MRLWEMIFTEKQISDLSDILLHSFGITIFGKNSLCLRGLLLQVTSSSEEVKSDLTCTVNHKTVQGLECQSTFYRMVFITQVLPHEQGGPR